MNKERDVLALLNCIYTQVYGNIAIVLQLQKFHSYWNVTEGNPEAILGFFWEYLGTTNNKTVTCRTRWLYLYMIKSKLWCLPCQWCHIASPSWETWQNTPHSPLSFDCGFPGVHHKSQKDPEPKKEGYLSLGKHATIC